MNGNTMPSVANLKLNLRTLNILLTTTTSSPPTESITHLLHTCIAKNSPSEAKQIHSHIDDNDGGFTFATRTFLQNTLLNMYDKCGSLLDACSIFYQMTETDVCSWNMIIAAYRRHKLPVQAFTLLQQMQHTGIQPNQFTFSNILPLCASVLSIKHGLQVHGKTVRCGFQSEITVMNSLIDMHAKCEEIQKARELFDKMPHKNEVSWNTMIAGYSQNGVLDEALRLLKEMPQQNIVSWTAIIAGCARYGFVGDALEIFNQMQSAGVKPNSSTFLSILPVCAKYGALKQGMESHQKIIEFGFLSDLKVATALIDMYAKCGSIRKARDLFNSMLKRDVVSWNAIIAGYLQLGILDEALSLFDEMPQRNVISWTAIIAGYAQNGLDVKSLETLKQMQLAGIKPNSSTFASILPACNKFGDLELGMEIHRKVIEMGYLSDVIVVTALVDMYAKCGSIQEENQQDVVFSNVKTAEYAQHSFLDKALKLFKEMAQQNVVSWTAIIAGYTQNGLVEKALETFKQMQLAGVKPDSSTYASILPTCVKLEALGHGMEIHQKIIENGILSDVVSNALIGMYAKCGSIQKAYNLFDKMSQQDVVSWNAIITGFAQNGLTDKALESYKKLQLASLTPDSSTFTSILPSCAKLGTLEQGMEIHQKIIKSGFLADMVVNALIGMYAKCGSLQKARELFDKMDHRGKVSWNAMIAGYAMHGYGKDALKLFQLMELSGSRPNHVSFVSVLFACSHAGIINEGCRYFNLMSDSYCIVPTIDHYVCMIDLLGRAGYLEEALNFIIKMPIRHDTVAWKCLLGACRSHKNIKLGEYVATLLFELDAENDAPYVLLSNIYAELGSWGSFRKVRNLMKDRGIKKNPGCSWIEVHKMVHVFCVGDRSHPQTEEVYAKLEKLSWEMKAAGYNTDMGYALNYVEEEEKELLLCHHSEKLAIAFGLLNTFPGTTIRIVKNLRVCNDCHTAIKFISKVAGREIIVRDANRFHHYKLGQCSCGDYW